MKKAFVISDVHLTNSASPNAEALLFLIKKAELEAEVFIILGDLFDLWLGAGSYFKKQYETIIEEFKNLKATGCRLIYFEGNHDLHLKKFWEAQLGFEVFIKPAQFDFHGMKIWAEHGDEINRKDHDYLFLRWFLRTPPLTFLIHHLPSKISAVIGEHASSVSRSYTTRIENKSMEIFRTYAQTLAETNDFDLLITGHTHVPDDFKFVANGKSRRLINLGSWFDGPHYLEISIAMEIKNLPIVM